MYGEYIARGAHHGADPGDEVGHQRQQLAGSAERGLARSGGARQLHDRGRQQVHDAADGDQRLHPGSAKGLVGSTAGRTQLLQGSGSRPGGWDFGGPPKALVIF